MEYAICLQYYMSANIILLRICHVVYIFKYCKFTFTHANLYFVNLESI